MIQKLSKKHPNVLQLLPSLNGMGGVERYILELAPLFKQRGVPFFVASHPGKLVSLLEENNGIHCSGPFHSKNPWIMLKNVALLESIVREHQIDLIHVHSRAPAITAALLSKKIDIPYIATYHGTYNSQNKFKKLYNSIMVRGKAVIAISEFIRDHLIKTYPDYSSKIRLICEGIDTDYFSKEHAEAASNHLSNVEKIKEDLFRNSLFLTTPQTLPPVILFPARFTLWKGHFFFFEALSLLDDWDQPFIAICVGDQTGKTAYLRELVQCKNKLVKNPNHQILFHEPVLDIRPYYQVADVVVSCSLDPEAFGRTTAEALSFETLFIGRDIGATRDLAIHGTLVNTKEEYAHAIQAALTMPQKEREALTKRSRAHMLESYSLKKMTDRLFDLYEDLTSFSKNINVT